ncbi:hypothetical protein EJ06DRAFT_149806 [Trichodelitschia bisporula]|uniref:Uncharacterized protein n=1 Tax=Trichodelitschia bisporula TaxID=703511 RepID=A0A6G1HNP3_9PEZI|nr:hypothetical protein EJ06DRAFT_149806 [Trichodelitschia bisporula]
MAHPYQFSDRENRVTSPLDRQAQNTLRPDEAPSFKTNVHRAKTKKWVEAKSYSYEGDDWGEYDEDDEYGVDEAPPPMPTGLRQPGQTARSVTNPPVPAVQRRNSFDRGDEKRAFSSSSAGPPPRANTEQFASNASSAGPVHPAQHPLPVSRTATPLHVETSIAGGPMDSSPSNYSTAGGRQTSAASDFRGQSPLNTRNSPAPSGPASAGARFPPRKGSLSHEDTPLRPSPRGTPAPEPAPPASEPASASVTKPLPFIRPADIYKRMQEAMDKEKENQKPSAEATPASPAAAPPAAPPAVQEPETVSQAPHPVPSYEHSSGYNLGAPLATVPERNSEYIPDDAPAVIGDVGKNSEKAPASTATIGDISLPQIGGASSFGDEFWSSALGPSQGAPPSTSPPPTNGTPDQPLSHQPSLGFTSLVHQAFDAPVSKQDSLRSQPTNDSVSRSNTTGTSDISPIISRASSSAAQNTGRVEDRAQGSTPAIAEEDEPKPRPMSLETVPGPPVPSKQTEPTVAPGYRRDFNNPNPHNSPARSLSYELSKQLPVPEVAQIAISDPLNNGHSEVAQSIEAAPSVPDKMDAPIAALKPTPGARRSESPEKGRVRDLAGMFDAGSRRNSAASVGSDRKSIIEPPALAPPPLKTDRPAAEREVSFRPHLPGQWESYTTIGTTGSEPVEAVLPPLKPLPSTVSEVSLEPTTAKRALEPVSEPKAESKIDPLVALAAAGSAMGDAIKRSVGMDVDSPTSKHQHGDVLHGPLRPDISREPSDFPPTPLPKDETDTSKSEVAERPDTLSRQDSTDTTTEDLESDRLRREIVRSLSPIPDSASSPTREPGPVSAFFPPDNNDIADSPTTPPALNVSKAAQAGAAALVTGAVLGAGAVTAHESKTAPDQDTSAKPTVAGDKELPLLTKRFSWERSQSTLLQQPSNVVSPLAGPDHGPTNPASLSIVSPIATPVSAIVSSSGGNTAAPGITAGERDIALDDPKLGTEGLHVINAQPGDIPSPDEYRAEEKIVVDSTPAPFAPITLPSITSPTSQVTSLGIASPLTLKDFPLPPTTEVKPKQFREIMLLKTPEERISAFQTTQKQWAGMNSGLDNWLSHTVSARPELRDQLQSAMDVPQPDTPVRHKATASISRVFTKAHSPSASSGAAGPEPMAEAGERPLKGKDLLHTTKLLGGKGVIGAKGLFAKGKKRFGGGSGGVEKVDE